MSAPAQKAATTSADMANLFPPKMQSFPLYGDAAIPNSKPGSDEESGADKGWIQKVSRPTIQVYLPAKVKATGASVVIFPGGGYAGLTFDYEGTQRASFFIDHGIASFVVKYPIQNDQWMIDKSIDPLQDAQQAMRFARQHAGVSVEAHLFEKGLHGFPFLPRDRWQGIIKDWLTSNGWLCPHR